MVFYHSNKNKKKTLDDTGEQYWKKDEKERKQRKMEREAMKSPSLTHHHHDKHELTAQGLHKNGLFHQQTRELSLLNWDYNRPLEMGSYCLWMFSHWWAHQDAIDRSKTMVTQMALVKSNESKNNTKGPDCGENVCKESWGWQRGKGDLKVWEWE